MFIILSSFDRFFGKMFSEIFLCRGFDMFEGEVVSGSRSLKSTSFQRILGFSRPVASSGGFLGGFWGRISGS